MDQQTQQRKVLVLRGQGNQDNRILETIQSSFDITVAQSLDEALQLLREQQFDAVFSITADFLPLERAAVSQQAMAILNTIGEGVCITGQDGNLIWANHKLEGFGENIRKGVSERSKQAFDYFAQLLKNSPAPPPENLLRPRKYSFMDADSDRYFEMIATPMLDNAGKLTHVSTVIWEETASRRLQQRINAIDQAGRELVRLEAESFGSLTVEQRIQLVQDKIIRYAKELLHFDHFVTRVLNRQTNQLEVLFGVGLLKDEGTEVFANIHNNGITGYVAATGRSYICNNPSADPRYLPGLDGARCSLTIPLRVHDKIVGTLNVESAKEAAFSEDDRQMAEIFGRYIALALNILDLLVVERYQTTGEAADTLSQQATEPLNEIMAEASLLMEEYIGHDDMRHRLQKVVDHVTEVKKALKDVQAGPKRGLLTTRPTAPMAGDGKLVGKHILVVDDEQFIRQTISDVLQKYGCDVDTARDGREGIALLTQRQYDLVVSDIKLPFATGYDIFAAAHNTDRQIPVILMTGFGYDPNHSIVRANKEGLSAVLYKPFKVDQLMTEVRQAMKIEA